MKKLSFFLMAMLLTLGIGNAWGAETATLSSIRTKKVVTTKGQSVSNTFGEVTCTVTRNSGNEPGFYTSKGIVRYYKNDVMTLSVEEGNVITGIEFTMYDGSLGTAQPEGLSGKSWAGSSTSVSFTGTGTVKISKIVVTYDAYSSGDVVVKTLKSIAVEGMTTEYEQGDDFKFDGTCKATYSVVKNDVAQEDETRTVVPVVSTPNMDQIGTQTITVSYTDGEETATTSYDITVTENVITAGTYNITPNNSFWGTNFGGSITGTDLNNTYTGMQDDITIQYSKGSGSSMYINNSQTRVYNGTKLVFSVPTDYVITAITFTADESNWAGTHNANVGSMTDSKNWNGSAEAVTITFGGTCRITKITVTYEKLAADAVVSPIISGVDEFVESTEVTISAEEGLKVYYTLDGTDPTNASTEYTAPFELTATTTVKAVAYDGENASDIISKTFKKLQVLTCEEAADLCAETESADKYVIRGYVTNIEYAYDAGYNNISFWMADTKNGGEVFEAYRAQPIADADKAVKVGDYVEVIGNIVLYGTTPETTQGGTYTIIPAPVVNHTITVSANPAEAGTVTGGGEFEETNEITVKAVANEGYEFVNWTENEVEVSTDAEYTFEVLADRSLVANFKEAEPEGIEVVLENAYKEVYLVWNRANFFGEHATYGKISVQINNYNGYGTYAEGVSSRIDGVNVNGSATFENKGETDLLTATLTDAEGTVYIIKAEVPTPKTYEVVATNATYVNVDQGWTAELTVNGLTVGEEELTLKVYWDGVGGSEEGYEASAGFEGSLQGMILVDKGEGDVLSFEGTLKDASDNSYIFDFEATPKAAETYTLTFEEMVIEPGQWDDHLHITAENTEYAIEFQLFGGKTKGYGEYGFTDDYPDVDEIYINSEYATMAKGTVANYYLNEETSLATIELTVVLGIDIYNITLTGQPLVNPEDIEPTDTINIAMTKATIGLYMGMPKVAASSEEAELSIVLVGENPYKATVEDFSASSYLVTVAGELTFLRGGLEIVEVGDVKIAYIGVLCSDHKWYNITLTTGTELPTALENLDTTVAPAKAIVNGQLVIIKNGVQYNAQGAVVK